MENHELTAVQKRLVEVSEALDAIPKRVPAVKQVERWRELLEEKEQLEAKLSDRKAVYS